jgi:predicted PurR-regulated permease PerM
MSRVVSFVVLIAITLVISLLFYRVLAGFFVPLFLAVVLVVVFDPFYRWVLIQTKDRRHLAAGLTTLFILTCLLLPVGVIVATATVQGLRFFDQNSVSSVGLRLMKIRNSFDLEMPQWGETLRVAGSEVDQLVHEISDAKISRWETASPALGRKAMRALEDVKKELIFQYGEQWDSSQLDELIETASHFSIRREDRSSTGEGEGDNEDWSPAEQALALKSQFIEFKTEIHGGWLQMFVREMVNPTQEDVEVIRLKTMDYVRPRLLSVTQATGRITIHLVIGLLIMAVSVYFFLADGPKLMQTLMLLVPLEVSYEQELLEEFVITSRSVVVAMLLAALAQGLTAGLGYAVAGLDYLVLLVMLTSLAALIPFVGPMAVWVPVSLYMAFFEERFLAAGLLAAWGIMVVGTIDNLVKALVLHGQSQLHPLLALLSILGGVQALGAIGIVVGPMAVSMLQTLLGIVRRELIHFESHGFAQSSPADLSSQSGQLSPEENRGDAGQVSNEGPQPKSAEQSDSEGNRG